MIKTYILVFLLATILISCSRKITGFYYDRDFNKNTPDYCFISICKDSVYYNASNDILGKAEYKGTWTQNGDTLELHIPKPCKTKLSKLIESYNPDLNFVKFTCRLLRSCGDTLTLSFDTLTINDKTKVLIDSDGYVFTSTNKISKIEISGMFDKSYTDKVFCLKDSKSNDNLLFVGETDDWQLVSYSLINDKFLIDNGSLRIIFKENGTLKVSDSKYKRHEKCRK